MNHIKIFLPKLITEEQVAFVPGRSMSDHCILAQEVFNKFRFSTCKKGLMAIKVDMEQAYDSMCWPTLQKSLERFGFPPNIIMLIMECVQKVQYSILINGIRTNWIEARS
ncbi:integrator complex subunit 11 [Dendrobium catenatum]|uniref:Integrator complex subunit 11 n=1 Tax=Dendrobium catenatum TaxID=906689 RepID=A0A2I0W1X7_9ASPA|nr:integrator complex subunit 11 [Dendrobium catenatum]